VNFHRQERALPKSPWKEFLKDKKQGSFLSSGKRSTFANKDHRPKSGGMALALKVLGDKFQSLPNITIVYP
jgi:hypothetical protein